MSYLVNPKDAGRCVVSAVGAVTGVSAGFVGGGGALLQKVSAQFAVNLKFVPALGGDIYAYPCGDAPGTVTAAGVALLRPCFGGNPYGALLGAYAGLRCNRSLTGPQRVSFGSGQAGGYMVACEHAADWPEMCAGHFSFQLAGTPDT